MSGRRMLGSFGSEEDLLRATAAARQRGWTIVDTYVPFAIHGLDAAMGLRRSRLPYVCLFFGLLGAVVALVFQQWTMSISWPINVGGRPWNSLPAWIPVTFEMMVLFGGLGVFFAFLVVCRLSPGKERSDLPPGVSSDRFLLLVEETETAREVEALRQLFRDCHVIDVEERPGRETA